MDVEDWERVIDVNLKGTFYCNKASYDYFSQREGGGQLVVFSSLLGLALMPGMTFFLLMSLICLVNISPTALQCKQVRCKRIDHFIAW